MPLSDFRDTYSWREAVDLGPDLVQLAEQLPGSEELGLAFSLRQSMVKLPAAIAQDLMEDDSYTRRLHIARIAAALDIIDKVYPALDTADVRTRLDRLAERVGSSKTFGEQTPGAAKVFLPGATVHAGPADPAPKPPAPPPKPAALQTPPSSVPVVPVPAATEHDHAEHGAGSDHNHDADDSHDDEPSAPALKVPVMPDSPATPPADNQEDHVHSDSIQ